MPTMSFWLGQGHVPISKPNTGKRACNATDSFNHSWVTTESRCGGIHTWITLGICQQGRREEWRLDRPSMVLVLVPLKGQAWFPAKPTLLSFLWGSSTNQGRISTNHLDEFHQENTPRFDWFGLEMGTHIWVLRALILFYFLTFS